MGVTNICKGRNAPTKIGLGKSRAAKCFVWIIMQSGETDLCGTILNSSVSFFEEI